MNILILFHFVFKMKIRELLLAHKALSELGDKQMPFKQSKAISRCRDVLEKHALSFDEKRNNAIKEHSDPNGIDPQSGKELYKPRPDEREEMNKKIEDLFNDDVEISCTLDEDIISNLDCLTPNLISALKPLLC